MVKRIFSLVAAVLICVGSAGAYQWNGESFLQDWSQSQINPLVVESEYGSFGMGSVEGASFSVSGAYSRVFDLPSSSFSFDPSLGTRLGQIDSSVQFLPYVSGSLTFDCSFTSASIVFTFNKPVSSFSLSGALLCGASLAYSTDNGATFPSFSVSTSLCIRVGDIVLFSSPSSGFFDVSSVSYSSEVPISSFEIVCYFRSFPVVSRSVTDLSRMKLFFTFTGDSTFGVDAVYFGDTPISPTPQPFPVSITPSTTSLTGGGKVDLTVSGPSGTTVTASPSVSLSGSGSSWSATLPDETASYTFTASFAGSDEYLASSASCTVSVTKSSTDPDPPDPPGPDPGGNTESPTVTTVDGAQLAGDITLAASTRYGGTSTLAHGDEHVVSGITIPAVDEYIVAPSSFPRLTLSHSGTNLSAAMPSSSVTWSWSSSFSLVTFGWLLTSPSSSPGSRGSNTHEYVDFSIPVSGYKTEKDIYALELDGSISVSTLYRAGSRSVTRRGCSWTLLVNGAEVSSGTSDSDGAIQFGSFVHSSTVPISAAVLRITPSPRAALDYSSNIGTSTAAWTMTLGLDDLYLHVLEGEAGASIDLSSLYTSIDDAQTSIDSYDDIESAWVGNMQNKWDALQFDSFQLDSGLLSGMNLIKGIFNDIWTAFGVLNVIWIAPLMLGIALMVIGRISKDRKGGG